MIARFMSNSNLLGVMNLLIILLCAFVIKNITERNSTLLYFLLITFLHLSVAILTYQEVYPLVPGAIANIALCLMTPFFFSQNLLRLFFPALTLITHFLFVRKFNIDNIEVIIVFVTSYTLLYLLSRTMEKYNSHLKDALENNRSIISELKSKNEEVLLYNRIMAHDIKAPLKNIKGFATLLKQRMDNKEEVTLENQYLDFIESGIDELQNLVTDLLTRSEIESAGISSESIDLNKLIDRIKHSLLIDGTNQNLSIKTYNLGLIQGDKELLLTLFSNLISNSLKFCPKGEKHNTEILIDRSEQDNHTIISVKDNGIGINKNYADTIFQPFQRLHSKSEYEGTGLGLSICKIIMEKHNGKISLGETSESGTEMILTFPKSI